jgi:ABC-type antimicrobial peptide transport system permease subunit
VALGIGAFIALIGFAATFEEQWRRFYLTKGTDICVLRGSLLNKASMDEVLVEKLHDLVIVAGATPVSFDLVDFSQDVSAVAQGWVDTSFEFESLTIFEGRRFRADEAGIMLGEMLAIIRIYGGWPHIYPSGHNFTEAICLAWLISLLAGFLPAYRGARLAPTTALRYE